MIIAWTSLIVIIALFVIAVVAVVAHIKDGEEDEAARVFLDYRNLDISSVNSGTGNIW